ncbi:MAG: hypothetical protein JNJ88_04080 [Planctomycetes bacterium]|nr:hypothetical protein [Planctomycetota bacterium]
MTPPDSGSPGPSSPPPTAGSSVSGASSFPAGPGSPRWGSAQEVGPLRAWLRRAPYQAAAVAIVGGALLLSTVWTFGRTVWEESRGGRAAGGAKRVHIAIADEQDRSRSGAAAAKSAQSLGIPGAPERMNISTAAGASRGSSGEPAADVNDFLVQGLVDVPDGLGSVANAGVGARAARTALAPARMELLGSAVSLRWLARHQAADGSWPATSLAPVCPQKDLCAGGGRAELSPAATSAAIIAFAWAGLDESSFLRFTGGATGEKLPVSLTMRRGVRRLCEMQQSDGSWGPITDPMERTQQAICILALAEAYGREQEIFVRRAADHGIARLLGEASASQPASSPASRPARDGASPAAARGWALLALRTAERVGLRVPLGALDRMASAPFAEDDPDAATAAAVELWSILLRRPDPAQPGVEELAAKVASSMQLAASSGGQLSCDAWQFGAESLLELALLRGGRRDARSPWARWRAAMHRALAESVELAADVCAVGSWPDLGARHGAGRVYETAVRTMALIAFERVR